MPSLKKCLRTFFPFGRIPHSSLPGHTRSGSGAGGHASRHAHHTLIVSLVHRPEPENDRRETPDEASIRYTTMSKQQLQREALEHSGVSYEESVQATKLEPSLYERIGREEGFLKLSQLFYDRVFDDKNQWFLGIFSSSTKSEAVENQVRALNSKRLLYLNTARFL